MNLKLQTHLWMAITSVSANQVEQTELERRHRKRWEANTQPPSQILVILETKIEIGEVLNPHL